MTTILSPSLTRCLNDWISTHSSNTLTDILVITKIVWPIKTTFTCPCGTFAYRWMSLVFGTHLLYFRGVRWWLSLTKSRASWRVSWMISQSLAKITLRIQKKFSRIAKKHILTLIGRSVSLWSEKSLSSDIECHEALVSSPIMHPPDWKFPFETTCDANNYAVGAVPDQCKDNQHYAKSYANKTLTGAQYETMEKELLALVFALSSAPAWLVLRW